uniref:procollagen-proline 4-dioxygenase n=1 Tax=Stomoxys calcitrans TaxID=35570 RepID=A0A1I8NZV9_STOCA
MEHCDPFTKFKLLKRFMDNWQFVRNLAVTITDTKNFKKSSTIRGKKIALPTLGDMRGAARGISRLQYIYKLNSTDFSNGYILGQKYSSGMTAYNCYILGKSLYESQDYTAAGEWLFEAFNKIEQSEESNQTKQKDSQIQNDEPTKVIQNFPHVSEVKILEYLSLTLFKAGKVQLSLLMNTLLLRNEPTNQKGLQNQKLFEQDLSRDRFRRKVPSKSKTSTITQLYEQVCRGELQQSPEEKRNLHCSYTNKNLAFYLLGPLKMELLSADPFVALYYDVIYNSENEKIIATAKKSLKRSLIGDEDESTTDEIRISKNAWLDFNEHPEFLAKISKRLEDITGLSMETSEEMQVANYGVGGYYALHYDCDEEQDEEDPEEGIDRLMTAMFYLNNVDLGGATAFPNLRLAVPPIKGSLVVWYNLHKSLKPDFRTSHAGCPVLKGSKWISNIWFDSLGQELNRPCDLRPDHAISMPYKSLGLD